MKLLEKLAGKFGFQKIAKRDFAGALQSRLTSDWMAFGSNADGELRTNIKTLRSRCRDLERNNNYARRYFKLLENNVLGHCGVGLQMKIREMKLGKGGKWTEGYDQRANDLVEKAWSKWSRSEFCGIGGNFSWQDIQRIALRSVARDGAVLIRKHYPADNPFRFSLELVEIDLLDTDFNTTTPQGGVVRLGVEYDANNRVVAYHLFRYHPGELYQVRNDARTWRERVTASQIIHIYNPERAGQSTGYPWLASAMMGLKQLDGYCEAELVAARTAACKMGFIEQNGQGFPTYPGAENPDGSRMMETEPGVVEMLGMNQKFVAYDPTHPSTAFKDFVKATLRGIGAGLGVSYVSLGNDLESVNYSSIRGGLLEERSEWRTIQEWFINWFIRPIFEEWLEMSLAAGAIGDNGQILPAAKFDKFNVPEFKPRRWDWVDPLHDLQADVLAVEKGFKSRREIIAERGGDVEDVFQDLSADEALEESYGLDFDAVPEDMSANKQPSKPDAPDDPALTS